MSPAAPLRRVRKPLLAVCLTLVATALAAQPAPPRPATGATLVPDRFLRAWDPVTLFFGRDLGPAGGGPEDHPERFVTVEPVHPGAYAWLDRRTLQFRPAEPWPPLARFRWRFAGREVTVATLMTAPTATVPADGAEGLAPVESLALTFAEPIAAETLARAVTVELRPLPGIGEGAPRWLGAADFAVKVLARGAPSDPATYVLALARPIPLGTRALVHFQLSLDGGAADSFAEVAFATAEPFRILAFGCPEGRFPATPEGTRYTAEQALRCAPGGRRVVVDFSAPPADLGPVEGRNLVRLTPSVANLEYAVEGSRLVVSGDFAAETVYELRLVPAPLADRDGRRLELAGDNALHLYFPAQPAYLRLAAGEGLVERRGPRRVPVEGRGDRRLDLRLLPIDPLDRSYWPFPEQPLVVDEAERPPGPGEAASPYTEPERPITPQELAAEIRSLGSPTVSALVDLPPTGRGGAARFGLDLAPHLAAAAGAGAAGTYLVGVRRLDGSSERQWMRLQATDLALTTLEEPRRVVFAVTSLAAGAPVAGATVRVEGAVRDAAPARWEVLFSGATDAAGLCRWDAPGELPGRSVRLLRLVVEKGGDTLVLDPARPPDAYADNHWAESRESWLAWTQEELGDRGPQPRSLAHLFTERPVYRPDEPVHVKGYLRRREAGRLTPLTEPGFLVVDGPGDLEWRYPVTPTAAGTFYHRFDEANLPTGAYRASFEAAGSGARLGTVSFRKEAYRIPRFEVQLDGPQRATLDRAFGVQLTATYYAGGRVAGRPVEWRVTQYPYGGALPLPEGFYSSSDGRFSRTARFESTPALTTRSVTDADGGASLALDPTIEPTAQPRVYVVEATVTGADDQTVTATRRVVAVPPFRLGLAVPRYLETADRVAPRVVVVGPEGEPLAGQRVTVRLLSRRWHSYLQASDFSEGVARYVTDVVDEPLAERPVESGTEPTSLDLSLAGPGVYVMEAEARDRLGRTQVVAVDFYAGGAGAVAWSKPTTAVFATAADRERYRPGDTAHVVLESPFQNAEALAVVEAPQGLSYQWLPVRGGKATFDVPILGSYAPRLPVHFLLLRGRLEGTAPVPGSRTDLGKPTTLGATAWLEVEPLDNRLALGLEAPERALPGQEVEVALTLADPDGHPLAGEVTLWLVDQAVLALGEEQRLDPVPDFLPPVASHLEVRDTRGLVFGEIPFAEAPGGGEGAREGRGPLDRQTVRRNFQPVPFYAPAIEVGPDGRAVVRVRLSDDLTNFELRAKAVAGERFGFAKGHLEVRLPVIVQPALPRFVRPGDRFVATAVGRVVEGEGGAGRAEARFTGVALEGPAVRDFTWLPDRPQRLEFPVVVPSPAAGEAAAEVTFRVGVERLADGAGDAFEVRLPLAADRAPVERQQLLELAPGDGVELEAVAEAVRPGTFERTVLLSAEPAVVRMAAGLSFLLSYPHGCTEQRVSRARARLALGRFREVLHLPQAEDMERTVQDTLEWIGEVVDDQGLCAYWPGARGTVSLTAWVMEFLVEARAAGYPVDPELVGRLRRTLEQALRSDYARFIDGESWSERTWALRALAAAGSFEPGYAAELARRASSLTLEDVAGVLLALDRAGQTDSPAVPALVEALENGVLVRLHQGREVFAGVDDRRGARSGLILPSETRTVAEVVRALERYAPAAPRTALAVEGLVGLGRGDGWGSTQADAAALLALSEVLGGGEGGAAAAAGNVTFDLAGRRETIVLGGEAPTAYRVTDRPAGGRLEVDAAASGPIAVRLRTRYLPAADGSQAAARREGFVVSREALLQRSDPPERVALDAPGSELRLAVGEVVEEHVRVVNPEDRFYVAVVVPLAAGLEPLNPALATAPPEARPSGRATREPTYAAFLDDQVAFYYDALPKGSYDLYFRSRASVPGRFIQPPARAEMMYDLTVAGGSPGARVEVVRGEEGGE